jgi:hypothetical protein
MARAPKNVSEKKKDNQAVQVFELLMTTEGVRLMHGPGLCTLSRDTRFTSTRYYSTNIDAIELAIQDLRFLDKPNISATAKLYNVDRSTLSRRHREVTNPKPKCHEKEQLLGHQQEQDLVEYINKLTERGLPPTTAMVRNFAEQIAGRRPGNGWSQRFCTR